MGDLNMLKPMIRRLFAFVLALATVLSVCTGCGTLAGARDAKGTGARRVYDAPADEVWNAVPQALAALGLKIASSSRSDGCVLAEGGVSAWSWGEKIAVFVEEVSSSRTEVEVVRKKALATNATARDWENPVLNKIEDVLRRIPK